TQVQPCTRCDKLPTKVTISADFYTAPKIKGIGQPVGVELD
ncbi:10154_t:CDS:1, partial [Racocetra persica]